MKPTTMRFPPDVLEAMNRLAPKGGRTELLCQLVRDHDAAQTASSGRIHELKCWPADFDAVMRGVKVHEARRDDRGYANGDILRLLEWAPQNAKACQWDTTKKLRGTYTGRSVDVRVTHITRGEYGLPPDLAIMSIRREL